MPCCVLKPTRVHLVRWEHHPDLPGGLKDHPLCRVVRKSEHVCTWVTLEFWGFHLDAMLCVKANTVHLVRWEHHPDLLGGLQDHPLCRVVRKSERVCTWVSLEFWGFISVPCCALKPTCVHLVHWEHHPDLPGGH